MTDEFIALARKEYGDDNVQFDTKVQVVRTGGGAAWVSGWVYVKPERGDEE